MEWVVGPGGSGQSRRGLDGGRLAASVVRYDTHGGHWAAFVRNEPVDGRHQSCEEAMAAAEQAYIATSARARP